MTIAIMYFFIGVLNVIVCAKNNVPVTYVFKEAYSMQNILIASAIIGICSRLDRREK